MHPLADRIRDAQGSALELSARLRELVEAAEEPPAPTRIPRTPIRLEDAR